jgi:class 3 adenylate cyclase
MAGDYPVTIGFIGRLYNNHVEEIMDIKTEPETAEYIIALYDLENFTKISKERDSTYVFKLLDRIYSLTIEKMNSHGLVHIKNIGDASLMILNAGDPDDRVMALNDLKGELESLLRHEGFSNRFSFSSHVGEVTLGYIGVDPFVSLDSFGDAINVTFTMEGKPFRNRFTISPRLFRRLGKDTRRIFHKYTPQIVYLAD